MRRREALSRALVALDAVTSTLFGPLQGCIGPLQKLLRIPSRSGLHCGQTDAQGDASVGRAAMGKVQMWEENKVSS